MRRLRPRLPLVAALLFVSLTLSRSNAAPGARPVTTHSFHDFTVRTIEGHDQALSVYKGQVVLVVNTASRCGFTPQYEGLEALHREYHARGFQVLGFPANDFLGQEPGTNAEIRRFCRDHYEVTFPMYEKIHVKGRHIAPVYAWLTKESAFPGGITWNFNKFLIGPDGRVVARFGTSTTPQSAEIRDAIERLLPAQR